MTPVNQSAGEGYFLEFPPSLANGRARLAAASRGGGGAALANVAANQWNFTLANAGAPLPGWPMHVQWRASRALQARLGSHRPIANRDATMAIMWLDCGWPV
eukprot:366229-Chlamydomonas_euryale.AAC.42